jgi:conjugal transfer pilus assembly protein TraI
VDQLTEKILYWLSLDTQARALAESLLVRFHAMVGDLPASADDHHSEAGGLYQHSIEVGLHALQQFEGNILMEHKPDGSVDSFRSARNRPRWQYACFIAALCHDLGKVFDIQALAGDQIWCPLHQPYSDFIRRARKGLAVSWRPEREHGAHAALSSFVIHHVLSANDLKFLGLARLAHLASCLAESHNQTQQSPLARIVGRADQGSVEQAQPSIAAQPENKIALFVRALQELITNGEIGVNILGGQVYVAGEKTAIVVPLAVDLARNRLKARKIVLPPNTHLYNMLRNARLVQADNAGHCVYKIRVQGRQGLVTLSALIFSTQKIIPKQILSTLPAIRFEIEAVPELEGTGLEQELGSEEKRQ